MIGGSMRSKPFLLALILLISASLLFPTPVRADDVDPNSAWGEVVDENGNIRYDNLTDLGVTSEQADWMPSIPFVGDIQAEYHVYMTPSGNTVVLPTATTLLFMAFNPQESGMNMADSQLGNGLGAGLEAPGVLKALLGGYLDTGTLTTMGYASQDQFFSDVVSGQANIWSIWPDGISNFLIDLARGSLADLNLYTMLLLYTPGNCAHVPGGCPPEALALLNQHNPSPTPPPTSQCADPVVTQGRISVTARKLAPNFPLVVGQDPDKRGADAYWEVRVEPTIYTYWVRVPVKDTVCLSSGWQDSDCTTDNGGWGKWSEVVTGWDCEQRSKTYPESVSWATGTASLSSASRAWILGELSLRYPGAYLHHPYFSWTNGAGGFEGSTYVWRLTQTNIQLADPGYFNLSMSGATSGTPISAARSFNQVGGQVDVWLKEIAIIH